ncbi:MAG: hypothetical protein KA768_05375 [Desulfobulbus sp.]|nr:hypothetical protein [Desulfobulbus sp.]
MRKKLPGILACLMVLAVCAGLLPAEGRAAVAVQAETVSGIIVARATDQAIRLDNGQTYHPSRQELAPGVAIGQPITLRYFVEGGEKNVYFEYAPGVNSLKELPPVTAPEDDGPK